MKKESCLAYWESKYLLEFLRKINDLNNDIGAPQKCFGRYKSMWQTRRNVYANGSRDCNSNSSVYPNICTEERAALQLKCRKRVRGRIRRHSAAITKAVPQPLYPNSLLCACPSKGTVPPEGPSALVTSPFSLPDSQNRTSCFLNAGVLKEGLGRLWPFQAHVRHRTVDWTKQRSKRWS